MNDNEIVQTLQKANEAIETLQGAYEVMSALADVRKEEIESLQTELAASQRRERAAVEDIALRKGTELTPIYTCGGHGGCYFDDDDEDFWCPICHAHLGTHKGYQTTCPRCGQRVNSDSEPLYNYRDMRKSEAEWRGTEGKA